MPNEINSCFQTILIIINMSYGRNVNNTRKFSKSENQLSNVDEGLRHLADKLDITRILSSQEARLLLKTLALDGIEVIEPAFKANGVSLHPLDTKLKIAPHILADYLETLSKLGYMKSEPAGVIHRLPCGSTGMLHKLRCNRCGHPIMAPVTAIHHLRCNYLGTKEDYQSDKMLKCPSCKRPLRILGRDYNLVEGATLCVKCRTTTKEPSVEIICLEHGETYHPYELAPQTINRYRLNEEGKRLLKRVMFDTDLIVQWLSENNIPAMDFTLLQGVSGAQHEVALAVWEEGARDSEPTHVVDIVGSYTEHVALQSALVKMLDIRAKRRLLLVLGEVDSEWREMCRYLGVEVFACPNEYEVFLALNNIVDEYKTLSSDVYPSIEIADKQLNDNGTTAQ